MIWAFIAGGVFGVFCMIIGYVIGRISLLPVVPEEVE